MVSVFGFLPGRRGRGLRAQAALALWLRPGRGLRTRWGAGQGQGVTRPRCEWGKGSTACVLLSSLRLSREGSRQGCPETPTTPGTLAELPSWPQSPQEARAVTSGAEHGLGLCVRTHPPSAAPLLILPSQQPRLRALTLPANDEEAWCPSQPEGHPPPPWGGGLKKVPHPLPQKRNSHKSLVPEARAGEAPPEGQCAMIRVVWFVCVSFSIFFFFKTIINEIFSSATSVGLEAEGCSPWCL